MPTTFELDTPTRAKLASINVRSEIHGDEKVPAVDLKFILDAPNNILSHFDGHLLSSLYTRSAATESPFEQPGLDGMDAISDLPSLRFPKLGVLKWDDELTGYELVVDYGMGGTSNLQLRDCTVKKFAIEPKDGGTVQISFLVQTSNLQESHYGKLASLVQHGVEIELHAPELVQEEVGGGDDGLEF